MHTVLDRKREKVEISELKDIFSKENSASLSKLTAVRHVATTGLKASAVAAAIANVFERESKTLLAVADDPDSAGYLYYDLCQLLGEPRVAILPHIYKNPQAIADGRLQPESEILRTESLSRLAEEHASVIVTYPEALAERVASKKVFEESKFEIFRGKSYKVSDITDKLDAEGFSCVDFVYEVGQYSTRGSILDIFSYSNEQPYRIDFFGDEVESIRIFDIEKQLSIKEVEGFKVISDTSRGEEKIPLLDFINPETIIIANDFRHTVEKIGYIEAETAKHFAKKNLDTTPLKTVLTSKDEFVGSLQRFQTIEILHDYFKAGNAVEFQIVHQPDFQKNFDLISGFIKDYQNKGYRILISSESVKQTDRIASIFADRGDDIAFTAVRGTLHEGFIDHRAKLCVLTDHQIFSRFHKFSLRSDTARRGKSAMLLKEINQLKVGDFVVHHDHGIGQFGGLLKTEIHGKPQEVIKITYKGGDIIFVSIYSLHKISKYRGKEGTEPALSKLGTGAWERMKERTKSKVKDIARDLIKLYAKRLEEKGFQYSPDSYLQHELEASFLYEDTPDQSKATADIKADMESSKPMDRLVCGDVGFGKTEVAIRAAFKAATDGKQVAVLVPTTILALQHYKTFSERLSQFPVRIEYLSRAKSAKQTREILESLREGKIDILIGTHKMANDSVKFKDLGLLIIDEEQKFGVAVKEKLKELKANVDTLTLTATPIPRTLQFSLLGARDLSIINTPPPNRFPVITELIDFDEETIASAIRYEIDRNGQVFFINNKVQNIELLERKLKRIVPEARIAIAHGQMPTAKLEETVIDFINYEYDILLATTVVESGIDIPNVNTIFVNRADHFGLSDLHQLRGRVGRSNRKAYCYLITPNFSDITEDARRRLQAISTFSDLGSGFNIAVQDLDIRGAGNMLGAEQSGFIAELGYETYLKILSEAVGEIRRDEFAEILPEEEKSKITYVDDCLFESDLDLMLPTSFISNTSERISVYRELDSIQDETALEEFRHKLQDRFGKIPPEADELMKVLPLRWRAITFGVERLMIKKGKMTLYFSSSEAYYQSDEFGKILKYMSKFPNNCKIGESASRRYISISPVNSLDTALRVFEKITN